MRNLAAYDILINAIPYGWNYMVDAVNYLDGADLRDISRVTVSSTIAANEVELINEYHAAGDSIRAMSQLAVEQGALSIGGESLKLMSPVKIVWFNQTRVLRIFTFCEDTDRMKGYAETIIRRTFGTKDEMKVYKQRE